MALNSCADYVMRLPSAVRFRVFTPAEIDEEPGVHATCPRIAAADGACRSEGGSRYRSAIALAPVASAAMGEPPSAGNKRAKSGALCRPTGACSV